MKKTVTWVLLTVLVILTACTPKIPSVPSVTDNTTSANVVSPNASSLPTAQINPELLSTSWTNADVFVDPAKAIDLDVGERFIIRYDYYGNMFARFEETDGPKDIVAFSGQTSNVSGAQPIDGVIWFFFQGIKAGTTNVTIKEFTHGPGSTPKNQKTFTINVAPPVPNISGNTTPNPWPNAQMFAVTAVPINVSVGQQFVIKFNQFTSSNVDFQPANIVVVESKQFVQNPGVIIPDGTTWILFKAVAAGRTNVSVTETTRFGDPLQTKTFMVSVEPPSANISGSTVFIPWPDRAIFADQTTPINVGVGQEFVIRYYYFNNMFTSFQANFTSANTVSILGENYGAPAGQPDPATGSHWYLLKAVKEGSTNLTIREFGHLNTGEQSQRTFTITVGPMAPQTVTVVSVASVEPNNPGSTVVQITLKSTFSQPIIVLNATLDLSKPVMVTPAAVLSRPIEFTFPTPIAPGSTVSAKVNSIGAVYNTGYYYPLTIHCMTQDGHVFTYTQSVQIQ